MLGIGARIVLVILGKNFVQQAIHINLQCLLTVLSRTCKLSTLSAQVFHGRSKLNGSSEVGHREAVGSSVTLYRLTLDP